MMQPRNITFILPNLEIGGEERVLSLMANELVDKHNATVNFVLAFNQGEFKSTLSSKINLIVLSDDRSLRLSNIFSIVLKFASVLRKLDTECIVSSLVLTNIFTLAFTKVLRPDIPVIIRQASTTGKIRTKRILSRLVKHYYPKANRILCVSKGIADDLNMYFKINSNKLEVINNPINIDRIIDQSSATCDDNIFDTSKPYIITVGRLIPQKDHATLINAFKHVREKVDCNLLIMGDGPLYNELRHMIDQNNLTDCVTIIRGCSNPYKYMKKSSLFVLSSTTEGFVVALLEALALGNAIVATDCHSSPAEILDQGKYGCLVPVKSPHLLAEKIIAHFLEPMPTSGNSTRAREFSMDKIIPKLITLIDQVVHSPEGKC